MFNKEKPSPTSTEAPVRSSEEEAVRRSQLSKLLSRAAFIAGAALITTGAKAGINNESKPAAVASVENEASDNYEVKVGDNTMIAEVPSAESASSNADADLITPEHAVAFEYSADSNAAASNENVAKVSEVPPEDPEPIPPEDSIISGQPNPEAQMAHAMEETVQRKEEVVDGIPPVDPEPIPPEDHLIIGQPSPRDQMTHTMEETARQEKEFSEKVPGYPEPTPPKPEQYEDFTNLPSLDDEMPLEVRPEPIPDVKPNDPLEAGIEKYESEEVDQEVIANDDMELGPPIKAEDSDDTTGVAPPPASEVTPTQESVPPEQQFDVVPEQ